MEHRLLSNPARLAGQSLLRMQSDARLTALARAGHGPAFDAIVARYRPALVRYCTRILGPDRAEDAVQQALAGAHAALTAPDDRPIDLRPWLYRIAHNAALNQLRASRRAVEADEPDVAGGMAPEEIVARREELDALVRAIGTLPRGQRDALVLRELEGRSHEEIAEALGVSRGAARQQLFRARAAVRAACSALTPLPLLTRLLEAGAGPVAAGGGELASHALTKGVAGVLAVTAVAGGAVAGDRLGAPPQRPVGPGDVKAAVEQGPRAPHAARQTTTSASAAAPTAAPRAVTVARAPAVRRPRRTERRHRLERHPVTPTRGLGLGAADHRPATPADRAIEADRSPSRPVRPERPPAVSVTRPERGGPEVHRLRPGSRHDATGPPHDRPQRADAAPVAGHPSSRRGGPHQPAWTGRQTAPGAGDETPNRSPAGGRHDSRGGDGAPGQAAVPVTEGGQETTTEPADVEDQAPDDDG